MPWCSAVTEEEVDVVKEEEMARRWGWRSCREQPGSSEQVNSGKCAKAKH